MVQDFKYPGHNPAPIWHKGAFYTISSMETGIYTTASLSPGAKWTKYSSINQEVSNGMVWTENVSTNGVDVGEKVCRCIVQANVVCSLLAGMRCGENGAPVWWAWCGVLRRGGYCNRICGAARSVRGVLRRGG